MPAAPPVTAAERSLRSRALVFVLVFAAVAPFIFFLFFLFRGGWLAISVALMAFPASLVWLALNSVPQGAITGLVVGLVPARWPWWSTASVAFLAGAAMTIANSLWLGLALVDPPASPVNLAAVGLIGGIASVLVAVVLCYALRTKGAD